MPATRWQRRRVLVRSLTPPWRKLFGDRVVRRHVQGVDLLLPWSHLLPDYAAQSPSYGQNLVELAAALHARSQPPGAATRVPLQVMDIGSNIGDSALQMIARVDARVLCVEGDPYWADFLRKNAGDNPRAVIEEVLLTSDEGEWAEASPVRTHGTTRFQQDADKLGALPSLSARALREKHPEFAQMRLIKSDTDGFDPILVPAAAEAWSDVGPVLFFEFDPVLARVADDRDPNAVWDKLRDLGYSRLAIWDNGGDPLGQLDITAAAQAAESILSRPLDLGYDFWDVAACRADDTAALAAFDELMPEPYSVRGTWR